MILPFRSANVSSSSSSLSRLDRFYRDYLESEDSARFIAEVSRWYTVETLVRLAEYGQRVPRRAAMLALGFVADFRQNDVLGRALHDRDRAVRMIAEHGLREVWMRDGHPVQQTQLATISRLLHDGRFAVAYDLASELIGSAPGIAETWNQRAIAAYNLELMKESAQDCHQALELNPYHFPAAIGMAHCYLELNDAHSALLCFQRALKLNPGLDAVRVQVEFLQRSLEEK